MIKMNIPKTVTCFKKKKRSHEVESFECSSCRETVQGSFCDGTNEPSTLYKNRNCSDLLNILLLHQLNAARFP